MKETRQFLRELLHRRRTAAVLAVTLVLVLPAAALAQPRPNPATTGTATLPAATSLPPAPTTATAPTATAASDTHARPRAAILLQLPRDLSPWGMFRDADMVVKAVMLLLALASLLTWTIWFAKASELMIARRRLARAVAVLSAADSFAAARERLTGMSPDALALTEAADRELHLSADALVAEGVKERIASRLSRIEAGAGRRMIRGTGFLATVGATAPFVGLFGTVWGIMNSFIGISKQHTTNLAVVAPGIAEALLATALGLVAAIPAVVMYNLFSRWSAGYRSLLADCAAEVLRLVSRDLDRNAFPRRAAERHPTATAAE